MPTSLPVHVRIIQDSRSSVQHERLARPPVDVCVLQLFDDHRPWELLDDTVLAIIDQTYAALLEILGFAAAPPEDGGPVKVTQFVYHAADPDSPAAPAVPFFVEFEASARHCRISLITGHHSINEWCEFSNFICQMMQTRRQLQDRRARVRYWPGTIHLIRADGGVRVRPDVSGKGGFLSVMHIPPGVSVGKGLLGVLDMVRSRLNTAIEAEAGMIRMARRSGCRSHDKLRDIFTVRTVLEKMRREVDIGLIMRRRAYERHRRAREIGRRRPAADMDVDQVDEEEVLAKRLKALHV